jgi:hypothetical protein
VLDQGQQGPDLLRTQHGGQCLDTPGSSEVKDGPRALPRPLGDEPHPLEIKAEGALGDFLRIPQDEARLAQLRFAEVVGSASLVASQWLHRGDITRLRLGGESPPLQGFQPTASACRHRHPPVRVELNPSHRVYSNKKIAGAWEPRKRGGKRHVGGTTQKATAQRFRSTLESMEWVGTGRTAELCFPIPPVATVHATFTAHGDPIGRNLLGLSVLSASARLPKP